MSQSLERPYVRLQPRFSAAPLDDFKRPYYPNWVGEHDDAYLMLPQLGVGFLIATQPHAPINAKREEPPNAAA